jgi:hypothetical protein
VWRCMWLTVGTSSVDERVVWRYNGGGVNGGECVEGWWGSGGGGAPLAALAAAS